MKLFVPLNFAVVSAAIFLATGTTRAQTDDYAAPIYGISTVDSYEQRIKSMEAEIKTLGAKVGTVNEDGDVCGCCDACCGSCGGSGCGSCCGSGCGSCCDSCCGDVCCGCGFNSGLEVRAEALIMNYHRADGMRVGFDPGEQINSSYNIAPRLTIGYRGNQGTGIRLRWFDYHHSEDSVNAEAGRVEDEFLSVDTYNFDVEIYDVMCINRCWTIETSWGIRFNDFEEVIVDAPSNDLRATFGSTKGAVVGVEARRHYCRGTLYGGLRGSLLYGDRSFVNIDADDDPADWQVERLSDVVQGVWELSFGYERSWCLQNGSLAYVRLGVEVQEWENFGSAFDTDDEDLFQGSTDVGFSGFTTAIGIMR